MKSLAIIIALVSPVVLAAQHVEIKPDTLLTPRIGIGVVRPSVELHLAGNAILGERRVEDQVVVGSDKPGDARLTVVNTTFSNGVLIDAANTPGGYGLKVQGTARIYSDTRIDGHLHVGGNLSKAAGSFRIDHPLDPDNRYLFHSFVESPDMMNIYNGNIITNEKGLAVVVLPAYFEALNIDFRYQLTVLGRFARAVVHRKIEGNRFTIKTSRPHTEVSWQVTGIRNDDYARNNRIQPEVDKPLSARD